jgi:hypothetical protein
MIRINCTNCKAQLSIDEAFAGGACRCQYCGTIQTVPKPMKGGVGGAAPAVKQAAGNGEPKSLYRNKKARGDVGLSSGLDAIADIVASSGLSGSGLTSNLSGRRDPAGGSRRLEAPTPRSNVVPLLIGAGVLIVLLVGMVIGLLMRGGNPPPPVANNPGSPNPPAASVYSEPSTPTVVTRSTPALPAVKVTGPNFLGVRINEPSVVFVLDCGNSTHATFDPMIVATENAIDSLRPDQTFQVIFWNRGDETVPQAYPSAPVAASNKDEVNKCFKAIGDVTAYGTTDPRTALDAAFAAKPAAVIVATGKPVDETFTRAIIDARKGAAIRVYCLSLGDGSSAPAMREVALKTGGTFKLVSIDELKSVAR